MTTSSKASSSSIWGILIGVTIGAASTFFMLSKNELSENDPQEAKKPLYWVAPMDANYRRDKPGKSPMGMDLVPVYEEDSGENNPGAIRVSPEVINNLGVRTSTVELKSMQSDIVTVGYVQYDEDKLIHMHPRVSGWVEKLYVKASGDPVKKGEPVYSLYSPELVNAQEEFLLAVNRENARLIQASTDRMRALQISTRFINKLKRSKKIQQTVTFYASQTGVVDNLNIREGFYVQPGTTLLSIGSLDQVWVEAEVFERQAALVKAKASVSMVLDYLPGKVWQGQVEYIYPTLDSKTRTLRVRLRFDNENGELKPNMFAKVTIHTETTEPTLIIPREALIRTGRQDRVVLALGEGRFKSVEVDVGRINQDLVEISEGLEENDKIVTSAQFLLDSESSKNSDFKRMHHEAYESKSVWVEGEIKSQDLSQRKVRAYHVAIPDWDWPEMTMNFSVADSVDFETLSEGTKLHMEITELAIGQYEISKVHIMEDMDSKQDEDPIDHSQMDHSKMDHSKMDHSKMDHSKMDHLQHHHDSDKE